MEYLRELIQQCKAHKTVTVIALCAFVLVIAGVVRCSCRVGNAPQERQEIVEDHMVKYPGRTFSYKEKFNDLQSRQYAVASQIGLPRPPKDRADAASMKKKLQLVTSTENYIVDSLTHSVPYLIPSAARELDEIGAEWADILARNGLPHYRFRVTSILRTEEDIRALQRSGNINSVTQSCHCFGTTFDLAYMHYDKVTRTRDYVHEDNLKLVLGQVLLNHQRAGKIYVKYEWKQSCFHITVRQ
ncbi:MAG: hypothetical protein IJ814_00905 [Paludibacteraceae bacterium]|nr:hypothetical protein [Paludibacteraceae bacterium]